MKPLTPASVEASLPPAAWPDQPPPDVPEAELRRGMRRVLDNRPERGGIWVFAYGSLIWEGGFEHDDDPVGTVEGLIRRYCIWDMRNRGTPARPALTLGLQRGPGVCAGVAFHLPEHGLEESLWTVWKQEMAGGYYTAEQVDVLTRRGSVAATTFVADPQPPLYAGSPGEALVAGNLAASAGAGGTAADYLAQTAAALRGRGASDPYLQRLENAVRPRLGQP